MTSVAGDPRVGVASDLFQQGVLSVEILNPVGWGISCRGGLLRDVSDRQLEGSHCRPGREPAWKHSHGQLRQGFYEEQRSHPKNVAIDGAESR